MKKLKCNNTINIPSSESYRTHFFNDPLFGHLKKIFISDSNNKKYVFDLNYIVQIDTITEKITSIKNNITDTNNAYNKLLYIHNQLILNHGSFMHELPEQILAVKYLTGHEKVLELGGNIGRNSLIIGFLLREKNNNNFVTLETDETIANQLHENRIANNMDFQIENSALSKRKLIQKDWNTIVSDELLDGYKPVNIISYDDLMKKYNIQFDTLILDCEGAFYYILLDMPEILNNINLIIMENDYHNIDHKITIDNILREKNFGLIYLEPGEWGPCSSNFYEVWKRNL